VPRGRDATEASARPQGLRRVVASVRQINGRFLLSCLNLGWTLILLLLASAHLMDERLEVGYYFLHLVNLVLATLWFDAEYFLNYTSNGANYRRRYLKKLARWKVEHRRSLRELSLSYAERLERSP